MRLIIMGPPGSGKGTQAEHLCSRFELRHVSTGEILRRAVEEQTELGKQVERTLNAGELVSDNLVNDLVAELFEVSNRPARFLFDGYPRTPGQAQAFDKLLDRFQLPITHVLLLRVDDDEIVQRIAGRRVCSNAECPGNYHVKSNPPARLDVCGLCSAPLIQRDDDKEETVRNRLRVYHQQTEGVASYFRTRGLLTEVCAVGSIAAVRERLVHALESEASSTC